MEGRRDQAPFLYLVFCHTDGPAVLRLAERIRELSPGAEVLLRHSRGPSFLSQADARAVGARVLHSDIRIRWGTWSFVEAVMEALTTAVRTTACSHVVLLSGQDHPIAPLEEWEEDLRARRVDALLNPDPLDYLERYEYCWHEVPPALSAAPGARRLLPRLWGVVPHRIRRRHRLQVLGTRASVLGHPRRTPAGLPPYRKGSLWMTLSRRAVAVLAGAPHRYPELVPFFRTTLLPDESFFQTVLRAEPGLQARDGRTSWSDFPSGSARPRELLAEDLPEARSSGAVFARKVVPGVSDGFTEAADALVDDLRRQRRFPCA